MPRIKLPDFGGVVPVNIFAEFTQLLTKKGYEVVTTEQVVTEIKKFCDTLQEYNIDEVVMSYDGSGDSGDGEFSFKQVIREQPRGPHEATSRDVWLRDGNAEKELVTNGAVSKKAFLAFQDAMWQLLPGGWEINDGAYGEVHLDVREKKIHVEHNERYTDVTTTERDY